jgi:hypothetical protein
VVRRKVSFLITVGTAICGGSAIAAVAPIARATDEEIAVSLGTVFVLNSVALLLFPPIGYALHMSQPQFGLWAALAIHDTSSVVGAAAKYGNEALAIGTTVKLARALWILPIALFTAYKLKSKSNVQWPWFILLFCLAAFANTYLPQFAPMYATLSRAGRIGLTVALFDWHRPFESYPKAGGNEAPHAGRRAVGNSRNRVATRNQIRPDRDLTLDALKLLGDAEPKARDSRPIAPRQSVRAPSSLRATEPLRSCRHRREVEFDFVDVAPAPVLSALERFHDRVLRPMKVFRGMLVFRRIATTHMSALQAQSQMHPCVAHLQTLFASVGCERFHVPNLIQMCTSFHANPPLGPSTYDCNPTPFGPVATTTLSSSWALTPLSTEGPLPR